MARFDTEKVLKNALALVKAELNTRIVEVDTEKNDFKLTPIPAKGYYFAQLPEGVFNYEAFVVYGFLNNPQVSAAQENNQLKTVELFFEVVTVDSGSEESQNVIFKLLRYSRALEDIFNKNFSKVMEGYGKLQVTSLTPTTLFNVEGKIIRSAGVSVTAIITAN